MFFGNTYHLNTKHSYNSIRINPNRVDWNNPPNRFKFYPENYERVSLNNNYNFSDFLYLIAGVTAKKTYPGVEYYLRVNPSAGALYPNEIYFQARNVNDLDDGIYHFEVGSSSLTLLKSLDKEEGIEANLEFDCKYDGFIFFISSIYYRSSWKYKNRAFRYCLLDAGHLLGSIEASSYINDYSMKIVYDFDKNSLNKLFNFDEKEFFTSAIICAKSKVEEKLKKIELNLPIIDGTSYDGEVLLYEENSFITNAYKDSIKVINKENQSKNAIFNYAKNYFKEIILKRRSVREFFKKSITNLQFDSILNTINQPICSDCDEVIDIFFVVNNVDNIQSGLYKNNQLLKVGNFSKKAGYLCLEQDLGTFSAVTFFLVTKSNNYQAAYQKAGVIGHRIYLSANYLQIGCSGIGAYYDDEVCEFLEENCIVLYALAIGN